MGKISYPLMYLVMLALLVTGCGGATTPSPAPATSPSAVAGQTRPAWQERWDKTLAEARKEGQVVVYSSAGPSVRTDLANALQEKYGIELQLIAGRSNEIGNRIISENERGLRLVDAINIGGGTLLSVLKPKGALTPLEPFLILPEVTDAKLWVGQQLFHDKDKTGVGFLSYYSRSILRNTDMVKEEDITNYADLLKPQWKAKIIMSDPTITGSASSWTATLVRSWGPERTKEYLRQLVKQEPVLSREPRYIYEVVARGKYAIGIESRPELMVEFQAVGAPLTYMKLKEVGKMAASTGVISLPSQPAHPNAAAVFLNWLLSKEGQIVAAKAWGIPSARVDVSREGFPPMVFPGPDEKYFVGDEEDYLMQGKMAEVNREIFAPLMK